ncbi:MAG: peptidylprolyl isomerase [Wenzhouxiangella sp.]|nr:peptidylprolyl isomerase [Wenzhouxiangella sp.]
MPRSIALLFTFTALLLASVYPAQPLHAQQPRVWIETDRGPILLELDSANTPATTQNFLDYVNEGFYDGLIFHRVIDGFVVQGGGFDTRLSQRAATRGPIPSEASAGGANVPRTIAMALVGGDVGSATTQFYINTGVNANLDGDYTVFGEVIGGWPTVETISSTPTFTNELPVRAPVIIRAVEVAAGTFPIMPLHTASWFDPSNPGVGFNLEVTNDASTEEGPLLIVYWYDFRAGQQLWLTGTANFEYGDSEVGVDLLGVPTPNEAADFQTPPSLDSFQVRGSVTVRFDGCSSGRFAYDLTDFGSGELVLTRLSIPDRQTCDGLD